MERMVYVVEDLPEKVAGVRVGPVLILRDPDQLEVITALCNGCVFRVVLAAELEEENGGRVR